MLLEFKASHDRLMAYEIVLEQPHVLDERINRITVSFSFFHSFFFMYYVSAADVIAGFVIIDVCR